MTNHNTPQYPDAYRSLVEIASKKLDRLKLDLAGYLPAKSVAVVNCVDESGHKTHVKFVDESGHGNMKLSSIEIESEGGTVIIRPFKSDGKTDTINNNNSL